MLRKALVRLAQEVPELRKHLVPLLEKKAAEEDRVGIYKGKRYKVLYLGPTKFGERARLQFLDGSKDFWVDAKLVTLERSRAPAGRRNPSRTYVCEECGEYVRPGTRCWETGMLH